MSVRNLSSDGHAAARQAEYDRAVADSVCQRGREQATGVAAVAESHRSGLITLA
jgi:hypothetical protein